MNIVFKDYIVILHDVSESPYSRGQSLVVFFSQRISYGLHDLIFRGEYEGLVEMICWWFRNPARQPPGMMYETLQIMVSEPSTVSPKMHWEEWFWNGIDRYDSYGEWYRSSAMNGHDTYVHNIHTCLHMYICTRNEYNLGYINII